MVARLFDDVMGRLARVVGCTVGQAYTLMVGFVVAVALLATGVPPVLQGRAVAPVAARSPVPAPIGPSAAPPAADPAPVEPVPTVPEFGALPAFPDFPAPEGTTGGPFELVPPPSDEPPPPPAQPLLVVASGWASLSGGTPAATVGVPLGTLPVGTRLDTMDKASFVRLVGTADFLVVPTDPDGQRDPVVGTVAVQACPINEAGWEGRQGASFEDSPTWDADQCVLGVGAASGHWSFDLGAFPDRGGNRGFALVPAPDAAADFQLAFSPS